MRTIDLEKWRGARDAEVLDPTKIEFRAHQSSKCLGCLFDGRGEETCKKANEEARRRFLPDCKSKWIFILVERDKRQQSLL